MPFFAIALSDRAIKMAECWTLINVFLFFKLLHQYVHVCYIYLCMPIIEPPLLLSTYLLDRIWISLLSLALTTGEVRVLFFVSSQYAILIWFYQWLNFAALWSLAWKGLTSRLLFVVSNCEFVTFPLVPWVRCGTWLFRFRGLIFAPLLTL